MKCRTSHVTNSSSSSFIVCFARITDEEKAKNVLDKYPTYIEIYTAQEALNEINGSRWSKWLEWDWAGIDATPSGNYIKDHIDDRFIVIRDYEDINDPEDYDYSWDENDHDPEVLDAIDAITEKNGFNDIDVQYGAGRNG